MMKGFFFLLLLCVDPIADGMEFNSPYKGKAVRGLVGSSLQFNWSFTGNVDRIRWGLSRADNPSVLDTSQILVSLKNTGPLTITIPEAYAGRVSGNLGYELVIFTIHDLKADDAGYYCCEIRPSPPSDTKYDHVELFVDGPPNITGISANQTVNEGNDLTLNCTAVGNPVPNITWTRLLDNRVVTMPLTNITRQHEGGYRCTANNSIGKPVSKDVFITVHYKPEGITIGLSRYSVRQGGAVKVTCVVSASNPPVSEYRFFLNGKLRHTRNNSSEITIENLQRYQDNGNYSCEAQNSVGFAQSDKAFLDINVPVTIQPFTKNTTVTEGNPINLTCHANGFPVPSVVWKKDGQGIRSTSVLNIESSQRSDSGRYICIANNTLQKKEMETFVTVNYPAYIEKVSPPSPHESWIAQNVTFVCKANGVPTPTIIWKRPNGAEIKRVVGNENVLRLLMQKDGDFGSYLCEADNTVGSVDKHTVQVDQIRPPDAPTITTQDKDIQVESLWVKWTPPIDNGGSNITGYRIIVLQDGKVIINKAKNSDKLQYFVDEGLTKSTNYTLRVSALNKVFEGMADEKNVMTKYQDIPEPVIIQVEGKDDTVILSWAEPENNGATIIRYSIYTRIVGDDEWKQVANLTAKDASKNEYTLVLERGKNYELMVTATNAFGESAMNGDNIQKVEIPNLADPNAQTGPTGVNPAIIAGVAAVGVLLILGLIILVIWRKRRKTPSETGSATAGLQGPYPDELADGYSAVGAAQQLQEGGLVADVTYAQVDKSKKKKKTKTPVTDVYAQVDKSKNSNKKRNRQPGELEYAELDDFRPNTQPPPQASGATARPLVRAPVYEGTEYADITQFGVPQSEPTYDNVPRKKDVVYSNVESM
ncbi:neural cell adhesion molecule 2-like isoform X2 [Montipora capricornis]|uniref:neural cell adhesion molecule 2-like isoform X2 n=1 Tax=Montipora capricornis TaxID=246305 RepID=UPI0035F1B299